MAGVLIPRKNKQTKIRGAYYVNKSKIVEKETWAAHPFLQ